MPGYNFNNYMLTNISKTTISERPEQRMAGYNTRSDTTKMRRLINTLKVSWWMVMMAMIMVMLYCRFE